MLLVVCLCLYLLWYRNIVNIANHLLLYRMQQEMTHWRTCSSSVSTRTQPQREYFLPKPLTIVSEDTRCDRYTLADIFLMGVDRNILPWQHISHHPDEDEESCDVGLYMPNTQWLILQNALVKNYSAQFIPNKAQPALKVLIVFVYNFLDDTIHNKTLESLWCLKFYLVLLTCIHRPTEYDRETVTSPRNT